MRKKLLAALLALGLVFSLTAAPAAALTLEEAKALLQKYYVDEIPESLLESDSLEEILSALGDPYTSYMPAEEYQAFLSAVNGTSVVGIGVSIHSTFEDGYTIASILPNSPALEAGLEAGDRIVAVDGTTLTDDMDIVSLITGEAGTAVTVTVIRPPDEQPQDYTLTRRAVSIPIVTYSMIGDAGFIDCSSFGDTTAGTILEALKTLDEDVSIWIMDLRSNPGGTAEAATLAAGLFSGNSIIAYFRDANGDYWYRPVYCSDLTDKPLVVLTSSGSASASELFAAAARDFGLGISVGQRTFGKGIAQNIFDASSAPELFDEDALKITSFRFYSPGGTTNHIVGVLPTLLVSAENTLAASLLLSAPEPERASGFLKLELAKQTFYIDLTSAQAENNIPAFTELLEALPPSAALYRGTSGNSWQETSPAELADRLGLDYHARTFKDIQGTRFEREITTLAVYQLLSGCPDGSFRPDQAVTRAEFCAMISTALNLSAAGQDGLFSDVSSDAWYAGAVSAMAARGFISGCGDGTFRPDSTITYEEMVTILAAVAAWSSMDGDALSQKTIPAREWPNYYYFSEWAQLPAYTLDQLGALVGDQAPGDSVTRGLAAGMLCTLMESINLLWD